MKNEDKTVEGKQMYEYTFERVILEKYNITATSKEEAKKLIGEQGQIPFDVKILTEVITSQKRIS